MKCSNGKYKYGERGRCQYSTLEECKRAAAAIHSKETKDLAKADCNKNCKICLNNDERVS